MDIDDNNIINNNKMIDMNSANKNQPKKTKKIKIDLLTIPKLKNDKKISINLNNSEKKKSNNEDNSGQNEVSKSDKSLNESTKIIKDNINLIEKEIISFKQHNLYIKQQLQIIFNKNKEKANTISYFIITISPPNFFNYILICLCFVFIKNVHKYTIV